MRRMLHAVVLVASLLAAGCVQDGGGDRDDGNGGDVDTAAGAIHAPWWEVGAWWDIRLTQDGATSTFRVVNFWNDTDTGHFWLGLADRDAVVDHALHDTNPLLGRIHWGILTPHESGIHASGMFHFDREDGMRPGDRWDGKLWGRNWSLVATAGATPGTLTIEGGAVDGARIAYDYDPAVQWFTDLTVKDAQGRVEVRVEVLDHGTGAKGTYHFIRGRDYYEGPEGGTEDTFRVCGGPQAQPPHCREQDPVTSLAAEYEATFNGPGHFDFVDPTGAVRHRETRATGGAVSGLFEIDDPEPGVWTVRYVGGAPQGDVHATGFIEYVRTL